MQFHENMMSHFSEKSNYWLTYWPTDWMTDWLTDSHEIIGPLSD